MFGFGLKAKAEKVIEDDLDYFVSQMYRNRFNHIVKQGKSRGYNEYEIAIVFVHYVMQSLHEMWGNPEKSLEQRKNNNDKIHAYAKNVGRIIHLANSPEADINEMLEELIAKSDQSIK